MEGDYTPAAAAALTQALSQREREQPERTVSAPRQIDFPWPSPRPSPGGEGAAGALVLDHLVRIDLPRPAIGQTTSTVSPRTP